MVEKVRSFARWFFPAAKQFIYICDRGLQSGVRWIGQQMTDEKVARWIVYGIYLLLLIRFMKWVKGYVMTESKSKPNMDDLAKVETKMVVDKHNRLVLIVVFGGGLAALALLYLLAYHG